MAVLTNIFSRLIVLTVDPLIPRSEKLATAYQPRTSPGQGSLWLDKEFFEVSGNFNTVISSSLSSSYQPLTCCFPTSPVVLPELESNNLTHPSSFWHHRESGIPPAEVLLAQIRLRHSVRLRTLNKDHPVITRLSHFKEKWPTRL